MIVLGALIASGSIVVLVLMLGLTARVERPIAPVNARAS